MAGTKIAVVGVDNTRCQQVTQQLQFTQTCITGVETADALVVVADNTGRWIKPNFLGPMILLGAPESSEQASNNLVSDFVASARWPWTQVEAERCMADVSMALRGVLEQDPNLVTQLPGLSPAMVELRYLAAQASTAEQPVLINSLEGSGSEAVARVIHQRSVRKDAPFVPINCALIPVELLEDELFGHEKGAFVGALTHKTGRFALANGGTLFVEHIERMPPALQSKFLSALQDGSFEPLGAMKSSHATVRIIATTSVDLHKSADRGEFRQDLLLCLDILSLTLPSLAERREDLPLVVEKLTSAIRDQQGRDVRLSLDALAQLAEYPWPGDAAELRNLIERLSVEYPHELVCVAQLPSKYRTCANDPGYQSTAIQNEATRMVIGNDSVQTANSTGNALDLLPINGLNLKEHLARLECSLIEQALQDSNSVVARAADRLQIRRTTLVEKMRKYGINRAS